MFQTFGSCMICFQVKLKFSSIGLGGGGDVLKGIMAQNKMSQVSTSKGKQRSKWATGLGLG